MTKPRKVNTIKALKWEIDYYKRQLVSVNTIVIDRTSLKHMKLQTMFSPQEVIRMSKDEISNKLIHRMTNIFADYISSLPIETSYDEKFNIYRAELDLWIKEVNADEDSN
jgi:hypothetical protein